MAASHRLHVSSKAVVVLSILLLPSFLLGSLAAGGSGGDELSSATLSEADKSTTTGVKKQEFHGGFDICKFTGNFRLQFFGVVIKCPDAEWPKHKPQSAGRKDRIPPRSDFTPVHDPPVSSASTASAVREEKVNASDGEKGKGSTREAAGGKDEL